MFFTIVYAFKKKVISVINDFWLSLQEESVVTQFSVWYKYIINGIRGKSVMFSEKISCGATWWLIITNISNVSNF